MEKYIDYIEELERCSYSPFQSGNVEDWTYNDVKVSQGVAHYKEILSRMLGEFKTKLAGMSREDAKLVRDRLEFVGDEIQPYFDIPGDECVRQMEEEFEKYRVEGLAVDARFIKFAQTMCAVQKRYCAEAISFLNAMTI